MDKRDRPTAEESVARAQMRRDETCTCGYGEINVPIDDREHARACPYATAVRAARRDLVRVAPDGRGIAWNAPDDIHPAPAEPDPVARSEIERGVCRRRKKLQPKVH